MGILADRFEQESVIDLTGIRTNVSCKLAGVHICITVSAILGDIMSQSYPQAKEQAFEKRTYDAESHLREACDDLDCVYDAQLLDKLLEYYHDKKHIDSDMCCSFVKSFGKYKWRSFVLAILERICDPEHQFLRGRWRTPETVYQPKIWPRVILYMYDEYIKNPQWITPLSGGTGDSPAFEDAVDAAVLRAIMETHTDIPAPPTPMDSEDECYSVEKIFHDQLSYKLHYYKEEHPYYNYSEEALLKLESQLYNKGVISDNMLDEFFEIAEQDECAPSPIRELSGILSPMDGAESEGVLKPSPVLRPSDSVCACFFRSSAPPAPEFIKSVDEHESEYVVVSREYGNGGGSSICISEGQKSPKQPEELELMLWHP